MTEDEKDLAIGRLVRQHDEIEKRIVALRSSLRDTGEFLSDLGGRLRANPDEVADSENEIFLRNYSNKTMEIDGSKIWTNMIALHEALKKKSQMEKDLSQAGVKLKT